MSPHMESYVSIASDTIQVSGLSPGNEERLEMYFEKEYTDGHPVKSVQRVGQDYFITFENACGEYAVIALLISQAQGYTCVQLET